MSKSQLFLALWLGLMCASAQADDCWWLECDGSWFDEVNWLPHTPVSVDTAYIDEGCGGPAILSGSASAGYVYVGFDEIGNTLEINGVGSLGLASCGLRVRIGYAEGSGGEVTLSGSGILSVIDTFVAEQGIGRFVQTGGTHQFCSNGAELVMGQSQHAVGTYELSGGALLLHGPNSPGSLNRIGMGALGGTGVFLHTGGAVETRKLLIYGLDSRYELSGDPLSTLSVTDSTELGASVSQGSNVFIQNGGTHTTGRVDIRAGMEGFSASYELVSGKLVTGALSLDGGYIGVAEFTQSGGVNTTSGDLRLARNAVYDLSGGDFIVEGDEMLGIAGNAYSVYEPATGTIRQQDGTHTVGGTLTLGHAGFCWSSQSSPGVGRYELSGGELTVNEEIIGSDHSSNNTCGGESRSDFIQSGGVHTVQTRFYLGYHPGIEGAYEISAGELYGFKVWVGYKGIGRFTQTGGLVSVDDLDLGRQPGASGTYDLSGDGILSVDGRLTVGRSGEGVLDIDGGTLAVGTLRVGRYSGTGMVTVSDASAQMTVLEALILGDNGRFFAEPGTTIHLTQDSGATAAATFAIESTNSSNLFGLANLELSFEGGADLSSTVEVGGDDLGPVTSGFANNFSLGTLRVGIPATPAHVMLMDDRDNALPSAEPEALYACTVAVAHGATLDLNGLNVYYRSLQQDEGGIIELNGGTLQQVGLDAEPDGDVDLADFARFQICFSGPNDAPGYSDPSWQCAQTFDQDCDRDVDSFDFRVFFVGFDGP